MNSEELSEYFGSILILTIKETLLSCDRKCRKSGETSLEIWEGDPGYSNLKMPDSLESAMS